MKLSMRHAPPLIDLAHAARMDWSRTGGTALETSHLVPGDVTNVDFDYYSDVFSFMDTKSLLFYLEPLVRCYADDRDLEAIDYYLFRLESLLGEDGTSEGERPTLRCLIGLTNAETRVLRSAVTWICRAWDCRAARYSIGPRVSEFTGVPGPQSYE